MWVHECRVQSSNRVWLVVGCCAEHCLRCCTRARRPQQSEASYFKIGSFADELRNRRLAAGKSSRQSETQQPVESVTIDSINDDRLVDERTEQRRGKQRGALIVVWPVIR